MFIKKLKNSYKVLNNSSFYKTDNFQYLYKNYINKIPDLNNIKEDQIHLDAALNWLIKAQSVNKDGGFSGRYNLKIGWTSSYPETTGYIIPTLINVSKFNNNDSLIKNVEEALDFLLKLQLENGAFPGGEIHENTTIPSVFNTGQILNGLNNWYLHSKDEQILDAALKAANWLSSVQDEDGAFRKFAYNDLPVTYSSHSSCWVAELGTIINEDKYLKVAERHLEWIMKNYDEMTGWIDKMGFFKEDHEKRESVTHTIAYTLWGVFFSAQILGREDIIEKIMFSAKNIIKHLDENKYIAGKLNSAWKAASEFSCLTGNVQLSLIWMKLFQLTGDNIFMNAAVKTIKYVQATQSLNNNSDGIKGGIAGSYPIWGDYITLSFPNWAAKFFIDAILEKIRLENK